MMSIKKLSAVIVEDEPKNRMLLKKMLEMYCPQVDVCGEANSVQSAVTIINQNNPDLVFLDIEISGGNAFQLLDVLQPVKFDVIFVTAYDSYLLKAIKYSALDYLLKPLNIQELIAAVSKSFDRTYVQNTSERIELLLQNYVQSKYLSTIALPTSSGFNLIAVQRIMRCEAKGGYTLIFTDDGKSYTASKTLKEYEDILPSDVFFRTHHSHLVNVNFIEKYHKGKGGFIEMTNKAMIPLAARRKNQFIGLVFGA